MNEARELRLAAFNAVTQRYAALHEIRVRQFVELKPGERMSFGTPSLNQHMADAEQVEKWLLRVGTKQEPPQDMFLVLPKDPRNVSNPEPPTEDTGGITGKPPRSWMSP